MDWIELTTEVPAEHVEAVCAVLTAVVPEANSCQSSVPESA